MMRRLAVWSLPIAVTLSLAACTSSDSATPSPVASDAITSAAQAETAADSEALAAEARARIYRIVTLGDVYTSGDGTRTPRSDGWPGQMVSSLQELGDMRIAWYDLAKKPSTSENVIEEQLALAGDYEPDVVTLQVGVDDIVAGDTESYAQNVADIFDELLSIVPAEQIFAITTPDHTLTPWGEARGSSEVVAALNAELKKVAAARDITVIDIGPVNERVALDSSLLVVSDPPRPYPTAKQYAAWAELIGPYVRDALESVEP